MKQALRLITAISSLVLADTAQHYAPQWIDELSLQFAAYILFASMAILWLRDMNK